MTNFQLAATVIGFVAILIAISGLRMDREYQRGVMFRLGRFHSVRGPGLYWVIPLSIKRNASTFAHALSTSSLRKP